jgi:hypothetical protein
MDLFMTNPTTINTIDIQSLIFQKDPKRFSSFSFKSETRLQRIADINIHKKPKIASEYLLITIEAINLNKVPKSFTNGDGNLSAHVDQGKTMNLYPKGCSMESKFIESGLWMP